MWNVKCHGFNHINRCKISSISCGVTPCSWELWYLWKFWKLMKNSTVPPWGDFEDSARSLVQLDIASRWRMTSWTTQSTTEYLQGLPKTRQSTLAFGNFRGPLYPQQKYFPLYWLFNRDPYFMVYCHPRNNWVGFHPQEKSSNKQLYTPNGDKWWLYFSYLPNGTIWIGRILGKSKKVFSQMIFYGELPGYNP